MFGLFENVHFRNSSLLLLALFAIPAFLLARRSPGHLTFSSFKLLPDRGGSWRTKLAWIPDVLIALAIIATSIALAGPETDKKNNRVEREGIAIMMVVDTSGSMRALDLSTKKRERTRLDAVKEVFLDFVNPGGKLSGRPDDEVGLISFAGYADSRAPLTLDHGNLSAAAKSLEIVKDPGEDGTAIGDALTLAVERLEQARAKSRVIILLTDGQQVGGTATPRAAAKVAKAKGVRVYTVGAGTHGTASVRVNVGAGQSVLRQMRVNIDEPTLKAVAKATGGQYFRATDSKGLRNVYRAIDKLETTKIVEDRIRDPRHHYWMFMTAGLLLAGLGFVSRETAFRRLP